MYAHSIQDEGELEDPEIAFRAHVTRLLRKENLKVPADLFTYDMHRLDPNVRMLRLWAAVSRHRKVLRCHGCPDGSRKGPPCGWALMICRKCNVPFCSAYFNNE